jgi:hypothetical protein
LSLLFACNYSVYDFKTTVYYISTKLEKLSETGSFSAFKGANLIVTWFYTCDGGELDLVGRSSGYLSMQEIQMNKTEEAKLGLFFGIII